MAAVSCVLLGVAEVKVPVKRLPQEMLAWVAEVAGWAVMHKGLETAKATKISGDRENFIGEVDDYYALREVEVKVDEEQKICHIIHCGKVILQHRTWDVAVVAPTKEYLRVVYISKSDSFARVAVVLQMKSKESMEQLFALFPAAVRSTPSPHSSSNGVQSSNTKDHKSSLGRSMGRLTTKLMASFTATTAIATAPPKKSPLPPRKPSKSTELQDSINSDSDSSSEDDSISDDTDSKSTGGYYEDMGFDATVQERLYDAQSSDSLSKSSDTSLETNALIIEAELKHFLETDEDFLKSLQSLSEDRERLTSADTPQLLRGKVILLFSQIKTLIEMHTKLHEEFENSDGNLQQLSEAITSRRNEYEKYVYFMENIPVVDTILETHKDYIKEHLPELSEKLRKPRMRLHYYVLTLETLCKKSSVPEDKQALQRAIDVLKVPLKKADSKLFLGAVVGSPVDLSNFGDLLRHSDLTLRKGGDLPRRVYHVLMLKTLIILTLRNGRNYNYVTVFRMDQVGLGTQERGLIFDLKVRGPRGQTVVYVFKAKNINLQQQWINYLKAIVKTKSQPNTPRNSYIEGDNDIKLSSKRKVNRGSSAEKMVSSATSAPIVPNASGGWDENDRSLSTERSGRRAAIKKSSSMNARSYPMARQRSGSPSESEGSWSRRRLDQPTSLNVWTNFPELKDFYYQRVKCFQTSGSTPAYIEKEYIEEIRTVLGAVLNEEMTPPTSIIALLRHIMDFHSTVFLPMMEKASSRVEVAQCFIDCSERLKECYSDYFAEMSLYYEELRYDNLLDNFRFPLTHFMNHVEILSTYQHREKNVIPQVQGALSMLRECVTEANSQLLTQSIKGAPFDLGEHAPVLHAGSAKVRWTGIMIRQDYHLVLLESMLLLLEPHCLHYRYVDALRMDTVGLGPVLDKHSFQLEVRTAATKTLLYTFRTSSSEAKEQWLKEITNLLKLQVEKLKEKQKRRLGISQSELVTVGDELLHASVLVTDL
ncbi:Puratrophin-1 [Chionoecetes opilio]|uniref:Puratrophin-1 n=1 Tax=Chionoecetes opilio TaxID=41210 RepID=A0A8J4XY90_CHIOP|nr:Puratrophin-1 [Chionoecetes opilio]